jgi:tetratricopeptide (TPR) repeat protein
MRVLRVLRVLRAGGGDGGGRAGAAGVCAAADPDAASAEALYRSRAVRGGDTGAGFAADAAGRRLLVRVLLEVGRYDDAERAALNGVGAGRSADALANVAGEALRARGRLQEAEARSRGRRVGRAGRSAGAAESGGGTVGPRRARRSAARLRWFIDFYNEGQRAHGGRADAVATAVRYLGASDPALFQDAVNAYEEAARADPRHLESRLLEGELFLEKYNSTEATSLFRDVLALNPRHPRALLGLARAKAFDGTDEAIALVDSSLAMNPNLVDARVFRARLLLGLERSTRPAPRSRRRWR